MGKYLDGVEWYEREELTPRLRVSVNLSSQSGRITLNSRLMDIISEKFVQIGFNNKNPDLMLDKVVNGKIVKVSPIILSVKSEPGENVFPIITTEKSKIGTINLTGQANQLVNNNLVGLYKVEYIEEDDVYVTVEVVDEDKD